MTTEQKITRLYNLIECYYHMLINGYSVSESVPQTQKQNNH